MGNPVIEIGDEWATTSASGAVRLVDEGLSAAWERHVDGPGIWRWQLDQADTAAPLVATVNACADKVLVPMRGWPPRVGPTVMVGRPGGRVLSLTLGEVSDAGEIQDAVGVVLMEAWREAERG
jgi:hypothetical protein